MNLEFWRWSSSLPGVQINKFTPFSKRILSIFRFIPPINNPIVLLWYYPSFFATSKTWMANSLVGVIIITPVPFICLNYSSLSFSKQGIRYESVFPDPVFAAPRTSLPLRSSGKVRAWMWVIVTYEFFSKDFSVCSEREKSVNFLSEKYQAVFSYSRAGWWPRGTSSSFARFSYLF